MLAEGGDGLLQRGLEVVAMGEVQVDVLDSEAPQGDLQRGVDRFGAQALGALRVAARPEWLAADLGGEFDPVADSRPGCEPAAEQFLALAAVATLVVPEGVAVGGVDPDATRVDVRVQ
jgi:hypothetical protein